MENRKMQLIEVFEDTRQFYKENDILRSAIEYGRQNTRLYEADDYPILVEPEDRTSNVSMPRMKEIRVTSIG